MTSKHNKHHRSSNANVHASYNPYGRDDDYTASGSRYNDYSAQEYDANIGSGDMPSSHAGASAQQRQGGQGAPSGHQGTGAMPAQNGRGRTTATSGGGARSGSHNRSHSRGMSSTNACANQAHLASLRHNIQHRRCGDKNCDLPVVWRNAEDVFVAGHMQGGINHGVNNFSNFNNVNSNVNTGLNTSGSLGPIYANQDERDYQMKLMDISHMTNLPLADLAAVTKLSDGVVPAFDDLPLTSNGPTGHHTMPSVITGAGLPHQNTRAWECARYAVENYRRDFYYYNRAFAANVILSPYCEIHTCRYFFSREQCSFQKIQFDTVCNKHSTCPVQRCQTAKTQIVDPALSDDRKIQWMRDEFCKTHGCAIDGCGLRCDQAENGSELRFCPAHRCYYRGCDKQGANRHGYCSKHKCQIPACQKISLAGFELCKKHIECAQYNCSRTREVLNVANIPIQKDLADCGIEYYDRKAYLLYCNGHAYCGADACHLLRKKPAIYCFKHVCNETGCGVSTTELLKFCIKHRCAWDGCIQPKVWKNDFKNREDYCLGHLCRDHDCGECAGEDRLYCDSHKCEVEGCMSKDTGGNFCYNHAHVRSQKKGESEAHAKTERLARVLQPSSHIRPDYPVGYYSGRPFTDIGSIYGEGSTISRSSRSTRSTRSSQYHGRRPSTSTRGHSRNTGASFSGDYNDEFESEVHTDESTDDDQGDPRDHDRVDRGRQGRGSGSSDLPARGGPPARPGSGNGPGSGSGSGLHAQVNQQYPPGGPMSGNGPVQGSNSGGPVRPMPTNGVRPMGTDGPPK